MIDRLKRVRLKLPLTVEAFQTDLDTREIVVLRYATPDWTRVYAIASTELDDLLSFCDEMARQTASRDGH